MRFKGKIVSRVRRLCLALPDTSERLSHGAPTFFHRQRQFAQLWDNHHGDGRFALWCAAPPLVQGALTETDPERFYIPPYVGHRGWLGVRLDGEIDWRELEMILTQAHAEVGRRKAPRVRLSL